MARVGDRKRRVAAWNVVMAFIVASTAWGLPSSSVGLEPARPGEIDEMRRAGTYARHLENAKRLRNHEMDPHLLKRALSKGKRAVLQQQGFASDYIDGVAPLYAPPPAWQGMPTSGSVPILTLLIDFNDLTHAATNSQAYVQSRLFGAGDPTRFPYDSLASYYARSSYDQLDLSAGHALDWYRTAYNRPADPNDWAQERTIVANLIEEAITHYDSLGHDFSQYDSNHDGVIDYFAVIWSGPPGPWASLWWGWFTNFASYDSTFTVDGVRLGDFSWQWEAYYPGNAFDPTTVIHETGHALGLPDLYDYDPTVGPGGGVGGLDMMDGNWGDHNCFSKWVLDWTTPTFVASGTQLIHLQPSATTPDCVVMWPGVTSGDLFSEFFVSQYRQRVGNDSTYPGSGMLTWHVDATLNGSTYAFNNSYTAHKLVRLMEADGLEEIEQGAWADAGDFWTAGLQLGPDTTPSSRRYDGSDSLAWAYDFSIPGADMYATFEIGDGPNPPFAISSGWNHTCALVNGGAWCWGENTYGQLGNGTTAGSTVPVQVPGLASGVQAIAAGRNHTCAVVNGGAMCWGDNTYGQIGSGSSTVPVPVPGLTSGVQAITAGFFHTCAVVNGGAQCLGRNSYGALGNGTQTNSAVPVQVSGLTSNVQTITAGAYHTCAVVNGGIMCWGYNNRGQLGHLGIGNSPLPVEVTGLTSGVQTIASGHYHTCGIVNGGAQCWGNNMDGQLGTGTTSWGSWIPVQVPGLTSGVEAIAAGQGHTCAIVNGGARCLGDGYLGQLGFGYNTEDQYFPVPVWGLTSGVQAVTAGLVHTCAFVNGDAKCWGYNANGQLGTGTTTNSKAPVDVYGL